MQLSYEEFADFLYREAAACSPAALQGVLAGVLVRDRAAAPADAHRAAAVWLGLDHPLPEPLMDAVDGLLAATRGQLEDPEFGFALLLPSEGSDLGSRLGALAEWCAAFGAEAQARGDWDEEAQGALADLLEIAELDLVAPVDEDSERELVELVEYVRIVVFNLYAVGNQSGAAGRAPSLH